MKAKMKLHKLLSLLLALVMVVGLLPTVAYAETSTVYITKIEINDFNPEFHTGMTGTAAKKSLTFSYPDDANYSKDNDNIFIKQNGSFIYGNNLTAGEATLIIPAYANPFGNNEENPAYDFDKDNLNSIEVWINGEKRTDVEVKGYNSAWRKVEIYIPVTVSEYTGLTHTVTFDSNGGTAVESQQVVNSGYASEPSKPTKDGKVFIGWYTDPELTTKFNFSSIPITSDITLYAKWEDKVVTQYITKIEINDFNPEFHTGMTGTAAKKSLTFSYPDDANYSKDNDNIFIKQNGSFIYGNNLTAGEATLIIPAYANPLSNNEENPAYDFDKENLNSVEVWINGEKRTDVEVKGYNSAWRKVEIYIPVTVSEYTGLKHTVSFAANGGTGTMADVTGVSGNYVLPVCDFTAPNGKQFKAWSVGGVEKAAGDNITVTANTTVTAVWEAVEYNVTVTGGTASVGAGTPITKATMGTTVTLTANAAPTDKVFDKWEVVSGSITLADETSATTTFTMPAGAVSVKATYKDAPHTHSWAEDWSNDETYHWHECKGEGTCDVTENSGKNGYAAHTYSQEIATDEYKASDATCTAPATYYKSCICGAKGTETFESGEVNASNHTFGEWINEVPATCKTTGTKGHKDCTGCNKHFDASNNEITDLTIPVDPDNHTTGKWQHNGLYHWKACTICDEIVYKARHNYGTDRRCDTCDYVKPRTSSSTTPSQPTDTTTKSPDTGDMGIALYAGMALLSLTGGAWVVNKKRKGK